MLHAEVPARWRKHVCIHKPRGEAPVATCRTATTSVDCDGGSNTVAGRSHPCSVCSLRLPASTPAWLESPTHCRRRSRGTTVSWPLHHLAATPARRCVSTAVGHQVIVTCAHCLGLQSKLHTCSRPGQLTRAHYSLHPPTPQPSMAPSPAEQPAAVCQGVLDRGHGVLHTADQHAKHALRDHPAAHVRRPA